MDVPPSGHYDYARTPSAPARNTPQEHIGCQCPECFGLAEYMLTLTGSTYGLERRIPVQHASPLTSTGPLPAPTPIHQPWQPRPARRAA